MLDNCIIDYGGPSKSNFEFLIDPVILTLLSLKRLFCKVPVSLPSLKINEFGYFDDFLMLLDFYY
jgi:hypothetical protein